MFFIQGRLDLHRPEYEEETDDGEKTETVIAMNEGHCKKNCDNDATCGCGSMPGEYGRSFDASSHWHYNGEYNRYIHLP